MTARGGKRWLVVFGDNVDALNVAATLRVTIVRRRIKMVILIGFRFGMVPVATF